MKARILFILFLLGLFTSCSNKEESIPEPETKDVLRKMVQMTFTCNPEGTRTSLSENNILWTIEDSISVLGYVAGMTDADLNRVFKLASGAGTTSATFTGSIYEDPDTYYAISPMQPNAKFSGQNHNVLSGIELPHVQRAIAGGFDPNAAIMVGKYSKTGEGDNNVGNFAFKNVCSYIKVTPNADCDMIVIEGNNQEEIAGKIDVSFGNDGLPLSTTTSSKGAKQVTLVGKMTAGQAYYVAVLPVTLSNGISIAAFKGDKYAVAQSSTSATMSRSKVKTLPFNKAIDNELFIDLGLTSGTLWASMNIGATAPAKAGDVVAWGELALLGGGYDNNNRFAPYKMSATWNSYKWGDGSSSTTVTKYKTADNHLEAEDDIATQLYGNGIATPTKAQWEELKAQCEWTFENNGYLVTSKSNSNSIFLPKSDYSDYWTSTVSNNQSYEAVSYTLVYKDEDDDDPVSESATERAEANAVRAVKNVAQ